jgi:hypothetical protein
LLTSHKERTGKRLFFPCHRNAPFDLFRLKRITVQKNNVSDAPFKADCWVKN